jgi:hypothetical protein
MSLPELLRAAKAFIEQKEEPFWDLYHTSPHIYGMDVAYELVQLLTTPHSLEAMRSCVMLVYGGQVAAQIKKPQQALPLLRAFAYDLSASASNKQRVVNMLSG